MSLLLLFQFIEGGPTQSTTPTPVSIQAIETIRPILEFVESATGEFQVNTTEYNETTIQYSDPNQTYGGADYPRPKVTTISSIDQIKPIAYDIGKI